MDEMRAMLDELMGKDRNLAPAEKEKQKPKNKRFTDPDVCKYYLCGFCPYEEFRRTKNDCGDCPAVHDENCKAQWDALDDREKDRYGFERDLMRWLDRLLADLRRKIDSNTERLKAISKPAFLAEDQSALDAMSKEIDALLVKAEALGEEGEVDAALAATKEADLIKERRAQLERLADSRSGNNAMRGLVQSVCPVSGLIINDEESRLRDHHAGRNYNSWKKLHEVHAELRETLKKRSEMRRDRAPSPRKDDRGRYDREGGRRWRSRSRDRGRRRSRSRSRSRDRYRDNRYRDRKYEESRGGQRDGERQRERERSPEEGEVKA